MKLLADAMLGRLAKWLRLLGYDTAYLADTDDYTVMRLARAEDRLVLTCDRALAERHGLRTLLVSTESLEDQLREVWSVAGPPSDGSFSRCSVCNQHLVSVTSASVADRVPSYIGRTHRVFSLCVGCNRVYWRGTHWQRMEAITARLRDELGFDTIE